MKLKYFSFLVGIDMVFLVSAYFFLLFIANRLRGLMSNLQGYTTELGGIENIMLQNISMMDYNKLNALTGTLKSALSEILGYFFIGVFGIFLLYCTFQGMNWNLAYNFLKSKVKIDYKYVLKFSAASIVFLSLGLFLFYRLLLSARYILLGRLVYTNFVYTDVFKLAGYGILLLLLFYFSFVFYALLNKYKLWEAARNSVNKIDAKNFLYFLASFFSAAAVIFLFLRFGIQTAVVYLVEIAAISLIVEKYKIYLLKEI